MIVTIQMSFDTGHRNTAGYGVASLLLETQEVTFMSLFWYNTEQFPALYCTHRAVYELKQRSDLLSL